MHLKVLEKADLLHREIQGRHHIFSLKEKQLANARDWLEQHQRFWHQSLNNLGSHLAKKSR